MNLRGIGTREACFREGFEVQESFYIFILQYISVATCFPEAVEVGTADWN